MFNDNHLQNKVSWFKDWKFMYKLISLLIGSILLILGFTLSVFIQHWYVNNNDDITFFHNSLSLANLDVMTSFWSVQTIVFVEIWFLFALIYYKREWKNKLSNFYSQLNITIYITITFIIFWSGVGLSSFTNLNVGFEFSNFTLTAKIIGCLTHLIIPLSMIIFFFIDSQFKNYKFKKTLISIMIYPTIYIVYVLIRATILKDNGVRLNSINIYPYNFLNFIKPILPLPLYWNALIMILFFIAIFWIISFSFITLNKIIWSKKWKIQFQNQTNSDTINNKK